MKPSYRLLINHRKNSGVLGFPILSPKWVNSFSKNSPNYDQVRKIHNHPFGILGSKCDLDHTHKPIRNPNSIWGNIRGSPSLHNNGVSGRAGSLLARLSLSVRSNSTSVETRVNDKNFERIYVQQGGLGLKPLVEKIDRDESVVRDVSSENAVRLEEGGAVSAGREESEAEKEAWRLLRNAVVEYCGSPVGTLAANDPGDKLPLNYDQVFIRDFVPSALAFLLKGEGEIVRNFLLHTLQLQVICL